MLLIMEALPNLHGKGPTAKGPQCFHEEGMLATERLSVANCAHPFWGGVLFGQGFTAWFFFFGMSLAPTRVAMSWKSNA